MRNLILAAVVFSFIGCTEEEKAEVAVVWHDTKFTPNRELARQSWELKKGDDIGLFGGGGQLVQFEDSHTAIKVRFTWNDTGIFVEGTEGIEGDWESKRIQAYPMREGEVRFESGISMAAFVNKIE